MNAINAIKQFFKGEKIMLFTFIVVCSNKTGDFAYWFDFSAAIQCWLVLDSELFSLYNLNELFFELISFQLNNAF